MEEEVMEQSESGLISDFWLQSPSGLTGTFWIRHKTAEGEECQFPVFISIRALFTLFRIEGLDPLACEVEGNDGYHFTQAVLRSLGTFMVETLPCLEGHDVAVMVTGVEPVV